MIRSGSLITPPESVHILSGVTRRVVLEMAAKLGLKARESDFHLGELLAAEEVFLTGTLTEIMPVVTIDDRPVGGGKPGKVTARFLQAYLRLTRVRDF